MTREIEEVDVTAQIVAMLGDIVRRATVHRPQGGVGGGSLDVVDDDGDVFFDSGDIVIEFHNGHSIKCWNSEWGGVTALGVEEAGDAPDAVA